MIRFAGEELSYAVIMTHGTVVEHNSVSKEGSKKDEKASLTRFLKLTQTMLDFYLP